MKKIEVFYKENECFIKDAFDDNLKITKAEKILVDKINGLIDELQEKDAEIKEKRDSDTWWSNRYNAIEKRLEKLEKREKIIMLKINEIIEEVNKNVKN